MILNVNVIFHLTEKVYDTQANIDRDAKIVNSIVDVRLGSKYTSIHEYFQECQFEKMRMETQNEIAQMKLVLKQLHGIILLENETRGKLKHYHYYPFKLHI